MTHEATASLTTSSSRRGRLARSVASLLATVALAATSLLLASAPAQAVAPAAPTINSITAGNAQLSVAFTAPDPGDSAITTYQYSTNAGVTWKTREDAGTTASPLVITNLSTAATPLVNGTSYSVAIRALNAGGVPLPGVASSNTAAIPSTVPNAPTVGVVTASNTQVSWAFTPLSTLATMGGLTVTNYEYSTDGGTTWTARSPVSVTSPVVITGLTNGTTYSLALRAVNPNGKGATSALGSGTPVGVPGAPTISSITSASGSLTVNFTAGSTGGSAITNYKYSLNGAAVVTRNPVSTASPLVISGLTNGTAYTVVLQAVNAIGTGPSSSAVSGTPATVPGAPTSPTAVAGSGSATVSWTAPASNGGAAISSYTVTSSGPGLTCTSATTSCTVTGLTAGGGYTFTVKATNSAGSSAASAASASVIPTAAAPGAPTGVAGIAGSGQATLTWSPPSSTGGAAITSYTATASPGGTTCTTTGTSCVMTGLSNGTAYTFTVKATNSAGTSVASAASSSVTPTTGIVAPGAPAITSVVPGDGVVTISVAAVSGGAPTLYSVISSPGGFTCSTTSSSCTIGGLTNGTAYTFTATASNTAGTSSSSAASASVTPTAPVSPTPTPTPTETTSLDAVLLSSAPLPGFATVSGTGGERTVAISPNKAKTSLDATGNGWRVAIGGSAGGRSQTELAGGTVVRVAPGQFVRTQGAGYEPNSQVNVFMMSTPVLLGTVTANADGTFAAVLPLPESATAGTHTIQVNGFRPDNEVLSVSMAIRVSGAINPIQRQQTFALGSPTLSAATKKALDALLTEPKRAAATATLTVRDARTAAAMKANPALAKQVATSVADYLRAEGVKSPVRIRYVAYSGTPRPASKGILVTVLIRS